MMENKKSGISVPLQQALKWYKAHAGNNSKDIFQASGAYIFRPDGNIPRDLPASIVKVTKVREFRKNV
jgi:alpha-mannosidase